MAATHMLSSCSLLSRRTQLRVVAAATAAAAASASARCLQHHQGADGHDMLIMIEWERFNSTKKCFAAFASIFCTRKSPLYDRVKIRK
jgi:hypothetical protein